MIRTGWFLRFIYVLSLTGLWSIRKFWKEPLRKALIWKGLLRVLKSQCSFSGKTRKQEKNDAVDIAGAIIAISWLRMWKYCLQLELGILPGFSQMKNGRKPVQYLWRRKYLPYEIGREVKMILCPSKGSWRSWKQLISSLLEMHWLNGLIYGAISRTKVFPQLKVGVLLLNAEVNFSVLQMVDWKNYKQSLVTVGRFTKRFIFGL